MKISVKNIFSGNKMLFAAIAFLIAMSAMAVYSSSSVLGYTKQGGEIGYYLFKHLFMLVLAVGAIYLGARIQPKFYSTFAEIMLFAAGIGLFAAIIMGSTVNGSARWIYFGGISIQPSEFAKIALILFISKMLARHTDNPKRALLPILLVSAIVCGLIVRENLSTCLLITITIGLLMFVGQIPMRYLLAIVVVGFFAMTVVIYFSEYTGKVFPRAKTWHNRIERWWDGRSADNVKIDPEEDYQAKVAHIAVATGGIKGKGPGNSYMKNFLPMSFSDFIFAIILEEYGMFGCAAVVFAYIMIFAHAMRIVRRCDKPFHIYAIFGLSLMLCLQAIINMCVGVGIIPVTGQTLPMVSMGGSSNIFTGLALGIIYSITIANTKEEKVADVKAVAPAEKVEEEEEDISAIQF
ncbi:MAG: FtsW/RodA/SpoVE family cell cycle protein [Bacteroidales bacterium]|nr:FtsW/RodA/SpoVE family cell cycle protein [Bacteroidales bacterium]